MSETAQAPKRYDILLVSQNRTYNVVEQGLKSLMNYLQASNLARVKDEAIAKEWTEIYAVPGPTAHEMFVRGAFDSELASYVELCVRAGKRTTTLPFGGKEGDEHCHFYIEIRGGLFNDLAPKIKNRLKDLLMTRFDYFVRDHEPPPPHAIVPPDEVPEEVKYARKDGASPRVGTAVEEF
ncbi:MAG: hypothetical protein IT385_07550 [Deltaproteobacteria bacterium]|nr:hypothetical protein [Deltaproteobacteria bacterium]